MPRFCLSNESFGFTPDKYLFDTLDEAYQYMLECVDLVDPRENERILQLCWEYRHERKFQEVWFIYDRLGPENRHYAVVRRPGIAFLMSLDTGEVLIEAGF